MKPLTIVYISQLVLESQYSLIKSWKGWEACQGQERIAPHHLATTLSIRYKIVVENGHLQNNPAHTG